MSAFHSALAQMSAPFNVQITTAAHPVNLPSTVHKAAHTGDVLVLICKFQFTVRHVPHLEILTPFQNQYTRTGEHGYPCSQLREPI